MSVRLTLRLMLAAICCLLVFAVPIASAAAATPWTKQTTVTGWLEDVHFIDASNGWAVGSGQIIKTTNGGATWTAQSFPLGGNSWENDFMNVHFLDANTGWAVGDRVLKTTNGGATWFQQPSPKGNYNISGTWYNVAPRLRDVYFRDANNGWAVGDGLPGVHDWYAPPSIFRSTNGGASWSAIDLGSLGRTRAYELSYDHMVDVQFIDASTGWITRSEEYGGSILKTTDGGATWQEFDPKVLGLRDAFFLDANTGWAVGGFGRVTRTYDGGATWSLNDPQQIPKYSYGWQSGWYDKPLLSVQFVDANRGYAVGDEQGVVFVSADGGRNWSAQQTGEYYMFRSLQFRDANTGWVAGGLFASGAILNTTVGGAYEAPTDIALNNSSVAENSVANTVIGTMSATDSDPGDTYTYSIVEGGDAASFSVSGDKLRANAGLDYEAKSNLSVKVRVTDSAGLTYDKTFAIVVTDVNEAPTDISLSTSSLNENSAVGTTVGVLSSTDVDAGESFTYELGGTDYSSFTLSGNSLRTTASFNYEAKSSYAITVTTRDKGGTGLSYTKALTITVTDVNEAPTNIVCDDMLIAENAGANAVVGTLASVDPDSGGSHTYTIVGGLDAESFNILGSSLRANDSFDYETDRLHQVVVRTTDQDGLTFDKSLLITVTDENDAPLVPLMPLLAPFQENKPAGSLVGVLWSADQDLIDTIGYELLPGADSAAFYIYSNQLMSSVAFDFETKSTYEVRVRAVDGRGMPSAAATFVIQVADVNEAPTNIVCDDVLIAENAGANAVVGTLASVDPDSGGSHTYAIVGGLDAGSFTISGTSLRAAVDFDFESKHTYTVTIRTNDQDGLTADKTFAITVTDVNEAPTGITFSASPIAENEPVGTWVATLGTTDVDIGDSHSYSIVGGPDAAAFQLVGGELDTAESFDHEVQSDLTVRIRTTDVGGLFCEEDLRFEVADVNEAPEAADDAYDVFEDASISISYAELLGNDSDVDAAEVLSVILQDRTTAGVLLPGPMSVEYVPGPDYNGSDTFTYKAFDGELGSNVATVAITVHPINDAPTFTPGTSITVVEDSEAYSSAWASEVSAGPANEASQKISFETSNTKPSLFSVQPTVALDGVLSFTLAPDANGIATVTTTLTDDATAGGGALGTSRAYAITVMPVADFTSLTVTSVSTTLPRFGAAYTLTGKLDSKGEPVGGGAVDLEHSYDGVRFVAMRTVTTTMDGRFSIPVVPTRLTYYRARFSGEEGIHLASASDHVSVRPRTDVGVVRVPDVMYTGTAAKAFGYLKPRHTAGTKPVRIYRYRFESGSWKSYGFVRAVASNYGNYTKYSATLALPRTGRWRLRAFSPADAGHAATWSSAYDYVVVRSRGHRAVAIAEAHLGKSFLWGGQGPKRFDSSGFVRHVYASMGVSLPRTAARQYAAGRKVSKRALKPGDLLFFYSPVSHVGIYKGNGMMIDCTKNGGVRVRKVYPGLAGATRPWAAQR